MARAGKEDGIASVPSRSLVPFGSPSGRPTAWDEQDQDAEPLVLSPKAQAGLGAVLFLISALAGFAVVGMAALNARADDGSRPTVGQGLDQALIATEAEDEAPASRTRPPLAPALKHQAVIEGMEQDLRGVEIARRWLDRSDEARSVLDLEIPKLRAELAAFEAASARSSFGVDGLAGAERAYWNEHKSQLRLKHIDARIRAASDLLKRAVAFRSDAISEALAAATDPDALVERVIDQAGGQGGPLTEAGEDSVAIDLLALAQPDSTGVLELIAEHQARIDPELVASIQRAAAVDRLLSVLPLAPPMYEGYRLTSRFGQRTDPITRRRAFHSGLDFGAPPGSAILATAPGVVVSAGNEGAYGILVEVDHGYGITTRYAHLKAATVRPGQTIRAGQRLGTIGSTGRSTGRHLHYEVLLDARHLDPRGFLQAGERITSVLEG